MSHPAKFSVEIVVALREILLDRSPDFWGRPQLHDPFAGTGEALARIAGDEFNYSGTELEACFIKDQRIRQGDATDPTTYPTGVPWVVITSPSYGANGMSDSWKMSDSSKRYTYRKAVAEIEGRDRELHPNNMGALGYRGTKRPEDGGRSEKRQKYWAIAAAAMKNWTTAELAVVNVSDSIYTRHGKQFVEPHVEDWCGLLASHGWENQTLVPVATRRMKNGANRDARVDNEVIIVAERATP